MTTRFQLLNKSMMGKKERGAILYLVAASLFVLIGFTALAVDLGHAYTNKSQLQNIADASALAGGAAMNGKPEGIDLATSRARDEFGRLSNKTEFNAKSVTIPEGNITFSTVLGGPWSNRASARSNAANIKFIKVDVPAQTTDLYFGKIFPSMIAMSFGATAVAGQEPQNDVCKALDPFSPIARVPTDTINFGFQLGQFYALRNDPNSEGGAATKDNPKPGQTEGDCSKTPGIGQLGCSDCGKSTLSDDLDYVEQTCGSVGGQTGQFGMSDPTKSGGNTRCFKDVLLNGNKETCISTGNGTLPTDTGNGGITVEATLQERFCQDSVHDQGTLTTKTITYTNDKGVPVTKSIKYYPGISYETYLDMKKTYPGPNRRVIRVAVNDSIPNGHSTYNVLGFVCFFMAKCPSVQPASSSICLVYIGSCDNQGNAQPPAVGNGASITKLVLFR